MLRAILGILLNNSEVERTIVPKMSRHPFMRSIARLLVNVMNTSKSRVLKEIEKSSSPYTDASSLRRRLAEEFKKGMSGK